MKFQEFESASGRWYVNCPAEVGKVKNQWYAPARLLGISINDYVMMLKNDFNASDFSFDGKTLLYSWKNGNDAHKFVLWINKKLKAY